MRTGRAESVDLSPARSIGDNFHEKGKNAIGRILSTNQMEEKREKMYATFYIEKNLGRFPVPM